MPLADTYFYNATVRKTVAVFGSLFNNLYTTKTVAAKKTQQARVPLSYGPRERFLVRIRNSDNSTNADVAVKLPRMAFEITSITYDSANKLNPSNPAVIVPVSGHTGITRLRNWSPWIITMALHVMARDQDSALQVTEQILPNFDPTYTVTVKDFESPGSRTDLPITLNSVSMQDDYEGDFETGRRTIIYTLEFSLRVRFIAGPIDPGDDGGGDDDSGIIKDIDVSFFNGSPCDEDLVAEGRSHVALGDPENDTPDNYTVITDYGFSPTD